MNMRKLPSLILGALAAALLAPVASGLTAEASADAFCTRDPDYPTTLWRVHTSYYAGAAYNVHEVGAFLDVQASGTNSQPGAKHLSYADGILSQTYVIEVEDTDGVVAEGLQVSPGTPFRSEAEATATALPSYYEYDSDTGPKPGQALGACNEEAAAGIEPGVIACILDGFGFNVKLAELIQECIGEQQTE